MDMDSLSGKRAAPNDSSGLDSVDGSPVDPSHRCPSKVKKPSVNISVRGRRDAHNRSFVGKAPATGKHSLPQQSKSVPLER